MVDRPGLIVPEITERYGVSPDTVRTVWARHREWPGPAGKRGRYKEYDAQAVADFVRKHIERQAVELEPRRLYTAQQLEDAGIGIKAGTIRADLTRGRWPEPDDAEHGVKRWYGQTAMTAMTSRRSYRRNREG
ncbi:hypothetical protein CFC35_23120 [Streptomyces sp. FBKL.4005]|uniref:hypothetical protein n=1 Tax=Streptomyces sp. FBKL.4005 TaxID=2015515 RepID=UPI000B96470A|nr:hypothetical protein [Streptomyces sp. FBKL.4005]OYP17040.1 hypothetical protein CFC35_23120 [Streptomyces sp. FBKL.4005]